MRKQIEIFCENTKEKHLVDISTSLMKLSRDLAIKLDQPVIGAYVNNELKELAFELYKPKTIRFIDISNTDGHRMYVRSLIFILQKALKTFNPDAHLKIQHSVSNGLYVEIGDGTPFLNQEIIGQIKELMLQIVEEDLPFVSKAVLTSEAVDLFREAGMQDKAALFSQRKSLYTTVYQLADLVDYFYGYLAPSSGYITHFDLIPYFDGMLLQYPKSQEPTSIPQPINQDKMFEIVREHRNWLEILGVNNIGSINEKIEQKLDGTLIKVSEALHEKKVAAIADKIAREKEKIRLVMISGPSSSGKTSFSKRLEVQLIVSGLQPVALSLDNYFVDREKTPLDSKGEYNFEALEAIDIEQFNDNLLRLMRGEEVELPTFDFKLGKQVHKGNKLKINNNQIIIVEGIHGLNPKLIPHINRSQTFKIYVSALTQVSMDKHNRIPTTDHRLLRRIVRDAKYRKYSALDTLKRWPSVRKGEEEYIFPYQEEADEMFNSSLMYELCVLKTEAEQLLGEVQQNSIEYAEARRLLKFLEYFKTVSKEEVPPTSLLREFVGGSSFHY